MEHADQIYAGPDGSALRFFYEPVKNNFQSEKAGRAIFDTALYCEVMTPGSNESIPKLEIERTYCEEAGKDAEGNRLVERTPKYVQLASQVEAFKTQSGDHVASGTPLSQWPQIDVGTAASLKAAGIQTVEMLAGVNDLHLQNLGTGGRVLRDQAQAFITSRQFGVPSQQLAAENANNREEVIRLTTQNEDLTRRLSTALEEVHALRNGQQPPIPAPGGPDPLSRDTISQPNALASLDSASASPLTPNEGEANENAKAAAETLSQPANDPFGAAPQNGNGSTPQSSEPLI